MNFLISYWEALLKYDWMRLSLFVGIIIGVLTPLIGSVVVIKRLSFIADTLSHFSLAGVCFGVLLAYLIPQNAIDPMYMGIIFSIAAMFLIEFLSKSFKNYKELPMAIIMSAGVALSGIFISLSPTASSNLIKQVLFGNIYNVDISSLLVILTIALIILLFFVIFYKKIITVSFDENYARISGINTRAIQLCLTIALAVSISLLIDIIGVLLISSLMIIPVSSSILIGKSFKNTLILSIVINEFCMILGFILSYELELATGPVVVVLGIIIFIAVIVYTNIKKRIINNQKSEKPV